MEKIRKFEIVTITLFLFVSMFVLNSVYAQDSLRVDSDEISLTEIDVKENVRSVAETVDEIRVDTEVTEDEVRDFVKAGIDRNIIEIRKETDLPAYELQKAVDQDRLELFDALNTTLKTVNITNSDILENFSDEVDQKIQDIEEALKTKSGLETDFEEERRSVKNTLLRLQSNINEKTELIKEREGEKIYKDTDGDGLSDYDEKYIYETDPEKASTLDDGENDGDKISLGIDPTTGGKINYADPREDVDSYVTSAYRLEDVALVKQEAKDLIKFEGRALPNSFVTLYIYSTPIIVTVKTDANGDWSYELDKELENGEHQMYVATVSNSGKIIARSNPVSFTKTSEAASIGIVGIDVETSQAGDFFRDNFILISLAILILVVVLALMIAGRNKGVKDVVTDLKNEVDSSK